MRDYKITIHNDVERKLELRSEVSEFQTNWSFYYNDVKSQYSVKMYEDSGNTYYDVCKNDEPLKAFEFDKGGLNIPSNLLEILTYILKSY